jgi:hypothetical protein
MNRVLGPPDFAEFADVPDGDVDRVVELRRDFRGRDPLAQDEGTGGDFGGDWAAFRAV